MSQQPAGICQMPSVMNPAHHVGLQHANGNARPCRCLNFHRFCNFCRDLESIAANDCANLGESQLTRARELLDILRHAAELKKEKCYVTTEGVDGKPVKELRCLVFQNLKLILDHSKET